MKKMKRNMIVTLMGIVMMLNAMNVYADDLSGNLALVQEIKGMSSPHNLGEIPENSLRFYDVPVKKPGKIKLTITGLAKKQKVVVTLRDDDFNIISEGIEIKSTNPNAIFYVKNVGIYTISFDSTYGNTMKAAYTFEEKSNQGGTSYSNAVTLKKGVKKKGILGFETLAKKKQYYKFKITKEELVKIKVTKSESCSSTDTIFVGVYKTNDKKNLVSWGYIYEGQKNGTLYIRNSKNHKTEPGAYYVVVKKVYERSGFDYSLTWLNK